MKNTKKSWFVLILLLALIGVDTRLLYGQNITVSGETNKTQDAKLEQFIEEHLKKAGIPGMSVIVVKDDQTVYEGTFGFNDLRGKQQFSKNTLFPLGMNGEAYTATGILRLVEQKKLKLSDAVIKYLPWLNTSFADERIRDVNVDQLLYHTGGLPKPQKGLYSGKAEGKTEVKKLFEGLRLDSTPGEKYSYSTLDYILLEQLIEKISNQAYESFMKEQVFGVFELKNTFFPEDLYAGFELAKGYKTEYMHPVRYDAPKLIKELRTEGMITSTSDAAKWLRVNIKEDEQIFKTEHHPDIYSGNSQGSFRAMGWSTGQGRKNWLFNSGTMPNYTSFLAFNTEEKLGIAVFANINSNNVQNIGWGIIDIIMGKTPTAFAGDVLKQLDFFSVLVISVAVLFIGLTLLFLFLLIRDIRRKRRYFIGLKPGFVSELVLYLFFVLGFVVCFRAIPNLVLGYGNWKDISVWLSVSFIAAAFISFVTVTVFLFYIIFNRLYPNPDSSDIFPNIVLSIASGFGNALIIFVINHSFGADSNARFSLFMIFLMGMVIYVCGQRLVRISLIKTTSNMIYKKRMEIMSKLLKTYFYKIEALEQGRVQAVLNNDTEVVSNFINLAISGITGIATSLCVVVYMGTISLYGLFLVLGVSLAAVACYYFTGRSADRIWEKTRDLQNTFFKYIYNLIGGFKELSLNTAKQKAFIEDVESNSKVYRDSRVLFDLKFANVFVIGELMFTFVIGVIAFGFPLIFKEIDSKELQSYVFAFFYLVGPVHVILNMIPSVIQVRTSWGRIKDLINEVNEFEHIQENTEGGKLAKKPLILELKNVSYCYKNENGEAFKVGPVNSIFRSGEITFITGGNGSGKSTLAKLITGLYCPDEGELLINGTKILPGDLSQFFSAVFSDYYLFEKLYGIDYKEKDEDISRYLKLLRIEDKIKITDGVLSTVKLSTGQRKRLGLMVCYLEDRPIILFDEWAADQDPEFRKFFYMSLLPALKEQGKIVIAITHDDRYFNTADKVIKMEFGTVVEQSVNTDEEHLERGCIQNFMSML